MGIHIFTFEGWQAGHPYAIFEALDDPSLYRDPITRGTVPAIDPPWKTVSVVKRLPGGIDYVALAPWLPQETAVRA